ncbi:unnamed protein product [Fusarium equiseti]|uniref:LysM domain-containing protein n=1 Tax=Fusarium equiseti TaxID=61235 RepID=A0A8J2IYX6_FUSEQ|nr:unnamed protein product [Fusarium equiseti]
MKSTSFLPKIFTSVAVLLGTQHASAVPYGSVTQYTNSSTAASSNPSQSDATVGWMDVDPNMPHDPDPQCQFWWDNDGSIACKDMPKSFKISLESWLRWNPSLTKDCGNYITGRSYCIEGPEAPPQTTTKPSPTTTDPAVESGQLCNAIAAKYGIAEDDIKKWNPGVGSDCTGIWANVYVCIGVIGGGTPTPSPTSTDNGVVTPSPTQAGMIKNCEKFHYVERGQTCAWIAAKYGIAPSRLEEWHTSITNGCVGLWANSNVCVRPQGYRPPTTLQCFNDGWAWGDNYQAAWDAVKQWCDGKDNTDGSYGYEPGQVKSGCFNTPIGAHAIRWLGRNDFGSGASLEPSVCEGMLHHLVQNCPKGGKSWFEGRYVE